MRQGRPAFWRCGVWRSHVLARINSSGRVWLTAVLVLLMSPAAPGGGRFHVAPGGTGTGKGTKARPWNLAYALSHPPIVKPGDTIWVHGGVYNGVFTSTLNGSPDKPIVVRQYPGERATLDNVDGLEGFVLFVKGSYTWYWGLEIRNTSTAMFNDAGVSMGGPGQKLINLVVHDISGSGITSYSAAPDAEIYGCLLYFNGGQSAIPGKGYGVYTQNDAGRVKAFKENIIPYSWAYGVHAYTEGNRIDNFLWEGNVIYNSGILWRGIQYERNFFIGSSKVVAHANVFRDNHSYYPASPSDGARNTFGYFAGTTSLVVTGNWFIGGAFDVSGVRPSVTGNTFYRTNGFSGPGNTFLNSPRGTNVFVRPNAYEQGRANIVVYNWGLSGTVSIDVTAAGLRSGDRYEVRDPLNWFGPPVATGVYTGGSITLPMTGLVVAVPLRNPVVTPKHTVPEFGAFVIRRAGS